MEFEFRDNPLSHSQPKNYFTERLSLDKPMSRGKEQRDVSEFWSELRFSELGPERRGYHSSFVHGDKLYIHGGHDIKEGTLDSMWALDLKSLKNIQGVLTKQGQPKNTYFSNASDNMSARTHQLDPTSSDFSFGWEKVKFHKNPNFKKHLQKHHIGTVREGQLGMRAGFSVQRSLNSKSIQQQFSGSDHQEPCKGVPEPIGHHSSVVLGNTMFTFGGSSSSNENKFFMSYSFVDSQWEVLEDLKLKRPSNKRSVAPTPRDGHTSCITGKTLNDSMMYIFGGYLSDEKSNQLYIYNFRQKTWRLFSDEDGECPCPRSGHSATIFQRWMFIFGGADADNRKLNDVWRFDLHNEEWERIEVRGQKNLPIGRTGHSCSLFGSYLVIFGGFYDVTRELNDLYLFDLHAHRWIQVFENTLPKVENPPGGGRVFRLEDSAGGNSRDITPPKIQSQPTTNVGMLDNDVPSPTTKGGRLLSCEGLKKIPEEKRKIKSSHGVRNSTSALNPKRGHSGKKPLKTSRETTNKIMGGTSQFVKHTQASDYGSTNGKITTSASVQRLQSAVSGRSGGMRTNRNALRKGGHPSGSLSKEEVEKYAPAPISTLIERRRKSRLMNSVHLQERIQRMNQRQEEEKVPVRKFQRMYTGINPHIPVHKQQAQYMIKKIRAQDNPFKNLQMKMQQKTIMTNISGALNKRMVILKNRMEYEEKSNVYGFKKSLLSSPTSVSMLNSALIKNADVKNMDSLFTQLKKRKANMPILNTSTSMNSLQGSMSHLHQAQSLASPLPGQRLQGIRYKQKPQARDGHTGVVYQGLLIVFGGDRHHMPFNDTYVLDLAAELRVRGISLPVEYENPLNSD